MDLDPLTLQIFEHLYPDFKVRVIRVYQDMWLAHRLKMKATEGVRTFATQAAYYQIGRSVMGKDPTPERPLGKIITNAREGLSNHHYGIAVDSCFQGPDPYLSKSPAGSALFADYGRFASAHGLKWGGLFQSKDGPHVELMYGGLTVERLFELYQHGGIPSVWSQFDSIRGITERDWDTHKLLDPNQAIT